MSADDDGRPVSDAQWEALERVDRMGHLLVVKQSHSDRSITTRMAKALATRGFTKSYDGSDGTAMLTEGGAAALATHRRVTQRRQQ